MFLGRWLMPGICGGYAGVWIKCSNFETHPNVRRYPNLARNFSISQCHVMGLQFFDAGQESHLSRCRIRFWSDCVIIVLNLSGSCKIQGWVCTKSRNTPNPNLENLHIWEYTQPKSWNVCTSRCLGMDFEPRRLSVVCVPSVCLSIGLSVWFKWGLLTIEENTSVADLYFVVHTLPQWIFPRVIRLRDSAILKHQPDTLNHVINLYGQKYQLEPKMLPI